MAPINWLAENAGVIAEVLGKLEVTSLTINNENPTDGGTGVMTFKIPPPVQIIPAAAKVAASETSESWFSWWGLFKWLMFFFLIALVCSLHDEIDKLTKRLDKAFPNQEVDVEAGNGGTTGSEEGIVDANPATNGVESPANEEEKEALLKNSKPESESGESDADSTSSWEVTEPSGERK